MAVKRRITSRGGYPCKTQWVTLRDPEDHNLGDEALAMKYLGPPPPRSLPWAVGRLALGIAFWGLLFSVVWRIGASGDYVAAVGIGMALFVWFLAMGSI